MLESVLSEIEGKSRFLFEMGDILSDFDRRLKRLESIVFHNDSASDESKLRDSVKEKSSSSALQSVSKTVYDNRTLISIRDELQRRHHFRRPYCLQDYNFRKIAVSATPTVSSRTVTVVPIESGSPSHHNKNKKLSTSHIIYSDNDIGTGQREYTIKGITPPPPLSRNEETIKSNKEKIKKNIFIPQEERKIEIQYGLVVRSPDEA